MALGLICLMSNIVTLATFLDTTYRIEQEHIALEQQIKEMDGTTQELFTEPVQTKLQTM